MDFDIVIPLGPNEFKNIQSQIQYVKKNVCGFRNIYIISYDPNIVLDDCIVISESIFPFKMEEIAAYFAQYKCKNNRNGWYLQQLLKLYAGQVIPDILPDYLVIDADVFFLKPLSFFNRIKEISSAGTKEYVKYFFTVGQEYWKPYFEHMKRLHPTFRKMNAQYSGISHHMMFSTQYVVEMMQMVEKYHGNKKPFFKIFIESIKEHLNHLPTHSESGASEYEIYFNYMINYHSDLVSIRQLKWKNVKFDYDVNNEQNIYNLDYVSVSSWFK